VIQATQAKSSSNTALTVLIGTVALAHIDPHICELRKMYLRHEARGRGLGSRLMNFMLQMAHERGYRRMELETADVLTDAIRLYERRGFRPTGLPGDRRGCGLGYVLELDAHPET